MRRLVWSSLFLLLACARPSELNVHTAPVQSAAPVKAGFARYYQPTWGDSSGKEGKGGTKLAVSDGGKLPLFEAGFDKSKKGDAITAKRADWQLFHGPGSDSLVFEWSWVTRGDEKSFGQLWGGGGVAFNESWVAVDATSAKYLVLWAKASRPGANLTLRLHSALKKQGIEDTGELDLERFVAGGSLDGTWRRVVIPLTAFPNVDAVELKGLQQVMFNVRAEAENERVAVYVDNVYLTNAELVTPALNLGYALTGDGLRLEWDKDPSEKLEGFAIALNGREVAKLPPAARSHVIPKKELGTSVVKVTLSSVGRDETSDPAVVDVNPVVPSAVPATLDLGKPAHDISPHVFGVNFAPRGSLTHLGPGGNRWGGNRTTKYNWKDDIDSAGSDWFFLNDYGAEPGTPETDKTYHRFVKETLEAKVPVNFTIPITPFIAKKHPSKGQRYCSYPTSAFPNQERTDGQGCGNGKTADGKPIWGNDPNLGMTKNSPELQKEFVATLVKQFGTAARGGVQFYSLDNEPGLWMHTHRDSMPKGVSAEELVRMNLEYAAAIKAADPTAKVIGLAAWGVKELAGSNLDFFKAGVADAHKLAEDWSFQDAKKRGGDSQLVYFLKEAKKAEARAGKRLIDAVDIHWYQELYAKNSAGRVDRVLSDVPYDSVFTALQFEALREWWDPTFAPQAPFESWTYDADPAKDRLWRPYHPVIPALKKLIDTHYPGTELAINEYDNGSPEHFHGALLRAAALGIFMREDLYMAQNWHQTGADKFTYWAQKLFGNYDGKGSKVAGKYLPVGSSSPELYAFGARRGQNTLLMLVNRSRTTPFAASVKLEGGTTQATTYTLLESMGLRLFSQPAKVEGKTASIEVPAFSAVLVELK